jgi:large subunit ribosomal protein L33
MREKVHLQCSECKNKNYSTTRNKKKHVDKYSFKKYCRFCKQHTLHKETK